MRALGLLIVLLATTGCDRWPEQLGGQPPADAIIQGPLHQSGWNNYPPLSSLGPEGLRVFIEPSFGEYRYLVDFAPLPRGCYMIPAGGDVDEGRWRRSGCAMVAARLIRMPNGDAQPGIPQAQTWRFVVPEEDFRDIIHAFDRAASHWRGDDVIVCDGTGVGIERVHAGAISSMWTNAMRDNSPGNPGAQLLPDVQRLVLAYGPSGVAPRSYDWTVSSDLGHACSAGLASPDPDGVGAGNDGCAQLIARQTMSRQHAAAAGPGSRGR